MQPRVGMPLADFVGIHALDTVWRDDLFPGPVTFGVSQEPALNGQLAAETTQHADADPGVDLVFHAAGGHNDATTCLGSSGASRSVAMASLTR